MTDPDRCGACGRELDHADNDLRVCLCGAPLDEPDDVLADGGTIRGLTRADSMERHGREALDAAENEDARYHIRHILQLLEGER